MMHRMGGRQGTLRCDGPRSMAPRWLKAANAVQICIPAHFYCSLQASRPPQAAHATQCAPSFACPAAATRAVHQVCILKSLHLHEASQECARPTASLTAAAAAAPPDSSPLHPPSPLPCAHPLAAPMPFKEVGPGMHALQASSKSAPAAADGAWTIPAAPAAPAADDASRHLAFFSSARRSSVGEAPAPQVPYGVPPATSIAIWATDANSLDLELSAAEVRRGGCSALPWPAVLVWHWRHNAPAFLQCDTRCGVVELLSWCDRPPSLPAYSPSSPPPLPPPQAQWLVSPPRLVDAAPASLQLAPNPVHPMRNRAAAAAAATKRKLRAAQQHASWRQLRTAVTASPLLSARIR